MFQSKLLLHQLKLKLSHLYFTSFNFTQVKNISVLTLEELSYFSNHLINFLILVVKRVYLRGKHFSKKEFL